MSHIKLSRASRRLRNISFFLLFFSLLAPIIFTRKSIFEDLKFTETGQIGDTIGGLMNPFIAIAGVITTFLAFLMQVEANNIQKEQLLKEMKKEKEKEKLDSFYHLRILKIDLENIITHIDENLGYIENLIEVRKKDFYIGYPLFRTSNKIYKRIFDIPRQFIYRVFELFVSPIENNWTVKFNELYNSIDFISDAFDNIYDIVNYHEKDIYNTKILIREGLIDLSNDILKVLDSHYKNSEFEEFIYEFYDFYSLEMKKSIQDNSEGNFLAIKKKLIELNRNIGMHSYPHHIIIGIEENIISKVQDLIKKYNDIDQKVNQLIPELENGFINLRKNNEEKLKPILTILDNAINVHS